MDAAEDTNPAPDTGGDAADTGTPDDTSVPDDTNVPDDTAMPDTGTPDTGPPPPSCESPPALTAVDVVAGRTFNRPVFVTHAPGDDGALYIVERAGRILIARDGAVLPDPFLDISSVVTTSGGQGDERGLLGLAFHPDYADNRRFFVFYTPSEGGSLRNVVAEYRRRGADPDEANPSEQQRLMDVADSEGNHNGGMVAFGPDGMLYVAMGDEGGAGDRHGAIGNGLDLNTLFGSMLRLDVDRPGADFAAAGNPFSAPEGLPQIWAYGLRNPWRFSFDAATGDMWIADVGQGSREEIDFRAADAPVGANFGWRAYEGNAVFDASLVSRVPEHAAPLVDIPRGDSPIAGSCSITGGYVYRGEAIAGLGGNYLFGDYCSPFLAAVQRDADGEVCVYERVPGLTSGGDGAANGLASFGEGDDGELYLVYVGSGHVRRIVAE